MTRTAIEVGAAVLERFMLTNERRQARALKLRAAIRRILEQQPHLQPKQIPPLIPLHEVDRDTPPSLRTVQVHMRALGWSRSPRSTSVLRT
jgi:hypothetical protein